MLYLFGQLFGHRLDFVPGGHGVCTPRCIEEDERHLGHTPQSLYLVREVLLSENKAQSHLYPLPPSTYPFPLPLQNKGEG